MSELFGKRRNGGVSCCRGRPVVWSERGVRPETVSVVSVRLCEGRVSERRSHRRRFSGVVEIGREESGAESSLMARRNATGASLI